MTTSTIKTLGSWTKGASRRALQLTLLFLATVPAWGAVATNVVTSTGRSSAANTIASPAFSTSSGNQLLLAFIATDAKSAGVSVASVTGAGLTWVLVQRANAQMGTAEIWRAFAATTLANVTVTANLSQSVAASITVISFTGVDTTGSNGAGAIGSAAGVSAASGAPSASLISSRDGSWVFGVGVDWDKSVARTVGANQTLVYQFFPTVGDTYWVQRQNSPTPLAGTQVFINDTAPTTDRYNLSIVEVLPPASSATTFSISGAVTPAVNGAGTTMTLSQNGITIANVTVSGTGNYSFPGLTNGNYTVTPSKSGFNFSPGVTNLTINGTSQTANFSASAQVWVLSGTVAPAALGSGTLLTLGGARSATTTADASGNFSFPGLTNGNYTVTPSKPGNAFTPASQAVTINGADENVLFTATTVPTWTLFGTVSPAALGSGTLLTLSGSGTATTTADASGNFSFPGLVNGSYTVSPSKAGNSFSPANQLVTVNGADPQPIGFTATVAVTWSISGTVGPAALGSGTLLTLSGARSATTTADVSGNFRFTGLANGSYTVTPSRAGFSFTPTNRAINLNGADATAINFTSLAIGNYPDLSVVMPPGSISISGTGANRIFRYTHLTYNGGPGPLAIQPVYRPAAGIYQGDQRIYRLQSGAWSLVRTMSISGAFFFHAVHGHFHFPFASFGLYYQNPDGSIGAPAVLSEKNGFCIADSYIYNSSLPNAGAFGNSGGSCGDPTALRGLSIGAVDEYNLLDPGQDIFLGNLPDGRYWLRAIADPDNLIAESNESNNETHVDITIVGNKVTENRIVTPVLPPPPNIALTSPSAGGVSGTVQLEAVTSSAGPGVVQFLVDGLPYGNVVSGPPYNLPWNTSFLQNGQHWLAAQTMDLTTERVGTSEVTFVTVNNGATNPPIVQVTGPVASSTVSAVVTLSANASAQVGVPSVQFYVDGIPLNSPVTAPPYMTSWNSQTAADGVHVVTAVATDQAGRVGNAAPVSFTVDNSHPANPLGIDALVFRDTSDTMQTPAFSTTTASNLLVAFVAYDGPVGPQTATVTGAGLTWQLVMRSNAQKGTSEIWAAKATNPLSAVTVTSQPGTAGYHGSLTVIAFTNAAGTGIPARTSAPTGAPEVYVPGVSAGNWVFAVGNDWDRAIARTPASGQVLVHQRVDTQVGDTFWVQSTAAPATGSGVVTIRDDAPTNDQWNFAAIEIVATRQ